MMKNHKTLSFYTLYFSKVKQIKKFFIAVKNYITVLLGQLDIKL